MTSSKPANGTPPISACSGSRAAALFAVIVFAGCAHNNYLNDNDELRRENLDLRQKVEQLQKNNDLRSAEVRTLEQQAHATTRPGMEGADVPRAVELRFERFSGTVHEAGGDIVRLYVSPLDQQGRFIPVAGRAVVQAVIIEAGQPPSLLAEKTYAPPAWDTAYRTGLTGTHYTLELPLTSVLPKGVTEITVKLTFTDAATGAVLTQSQSLRIKRNS